MEAAASAEEIEPLWFEENLTAEASVIAVRPKGAGNQCQFNPRLRPCRAIASVANPSTKVEVGENSFDIAGVGGWINDNIWMVLLFVLIGFIFYIFQPGGFAEKMLEHRAKLKELDAKQLDDTRAIADILQRRFDREDPLLPFDDPQKRPPPRRKLK